MGNRPGLGKAQTRRKVWRMHSKNSVSSRGERAVACVPDVAFYSYSFYIPRVFY